MEISAVFIRKVRPDWQSNIRASAGKSGSTFPIDIPEVFHSYLQKGKLTAKQMGA